MQAFPSISTGIYGYPIEAATHIALNVVREFLDTSDGDNVRSWPAPHVVLSDAHVPAGFAAIQLERTIFVVWSDADKEVYECVI